MDVNKAYNSISLLQSSSYILNELTEEASNTCSSVVLSHTSI